MTGHRDPAADVGSARRSRRVWRRNSLTVVATTALILSTVAWAGAESRTSAEPRGDHVARPTVEGPIEGGMHGFPFGASAMPLSALGYVEDEFFVSGTAHAYGSDEPLSADGRWNVKPVAEAPYRTRLLVRRPRDASHFNGVVIVEWLNVSSGYDIQGTWSFSHEHLLREGYAYVGVSAQEVGVNGFPPGNPAGNAGALKVWDPERYGRLQHPGDSFSYDIFSQAAMALLHGAPTRARPVRPLGHLRIKRLVAAGTSQSAIRLNTYINAVHPLADVYDGFLVQVGFGRGAPLTQAPLDDLQAPIPTLLRTDLDDPVMDIETETEILGGAFAARQPDTPRLRRWEIAGGAHGNRYNLAVLAADATRAVPSPPLPASDLRVFDTCAKPLNEGPQQYVYNAAVEAMTGWLLDGVPAPSAPLLEVKTGPPLSLMLDDVGNARGGVRSTLLDVPTAIYSGVGNTGPCAGLLGSTVFLDGNSLHALYGSHQDYVAKVSDAAARLVRERFLVPEDAVHLIAQAGQSRVGLTTPAPAA